MTIVTRAPARAGLLGNPSDQYFGKIIAISVKNFSARAFITESDRIVIERGDEDRPVYASAAEFVGTIDRYGYYGGGRLVKAALKVFFDYCARQAIRLRPLNFKIGYDSDIPRQVGLAGSSAIVVSVMRGLMEFYEVEIPLEILPTLVLQAERQELGINAGFMDRVAQVYEGCVYMDLAKDYVEANGHGRYERLDPQKLPPLYLAYRPELGKISGQVHSEIRTAYDRGDAAVIEALKKIAETAAAGRAAFLRDDLGSWPELMNECFDLRSAIMTINEANREMVLTARACGASANFAGSGGSIIGIYAGEGMFDRLTAALGRLGAKVIKPKIG